MLFDLFIFCFIGVSLALGLIAWLYSAIRGLSDAWYSKRLGALSIRIGRRVWRQIALGCKVVPETSEQLVLALAHPPSNPKRGGELWFRSDFPCRRSRS